MSYLFFLHEIINNAALALNTMRIIEVNALDVSDQYLFYKIKYFDNHKKIGE